MMILFADKRRDLGRHSAHELWNGLDDSRRKDSPEATGGLRSAPGVSIVPERKAGVWDQLWKSVIWWPWLSPAEAKPAKRGPYSKKLQREVIE